MNGVQTPVRRVTVTQRGAIVPTSVATIRAAIDAIEAGAWGEGLTVRVTGASPDQEVIVDEYGEERLVVDTVINHILRTGRHQELTMVVTHPAQDEALRLRR